MDLFCLVFTGIFHSSESGLLTGFPASLCPTAPLLGIIAARIHNTSIDHQNRKYMQDEDQGTSPVFLLVIITVSVWTYGCMQRILFLLGTCCGTNASKVIGAMVLNTPVSTANVISCTFLLLQLILPQNIHFLK